MPFLKNQKHELFALAYAKSGNGKQSAIDAGFFSAKAVNYPSEVASKLLKRPEVRARVTELQAEIRKEMRSTPSQIAINREWILASLAGNVEAAHLSRDHGAVNRGLELLGREWGLFTEKKHIVTESLLDRLTAHQLLALGQLVDAADRDVQLFDRLVQIVPSLHQQHQGLSLVGPVEDVEFVPGPAPEAEPAGAAEAAGAAAPHPPASTPAGAELGLPGFPYGRTDPTQSASSADGADPPETDPDLEDLL